MLAKMKNGWESPVRKAIVIQLSTTWFML